MTFGALQRYEEAVDSYEQALDLKPHFYQAWYNLGVVLGELRRYERSN